MAKKKRARRKTAKVPQTQDTSNTHPATNPPPARGAHRPPNEGLLDSPHQRQRSRLQLSRDVVRQAKRDLDPDSLVRLQVDITERQRVELHEEAWHYRISLSQLIVEKLRMPLNVGALPTFQSYRDQACGAPEQIPKDLEAERQNAAEDGDQSPAGSSIPGALPVPDPRNQIQNAGAGGQAETDLYGFGQRQADRDAGLVTNADLQAVVDMLTGRLDEIERQGLPADPHDGKHPPGEEDLLRAFQRRFGTDGYEDVRAAAAKGEMALDVIDMHASSQNETGDGDQFPNSSQNETGCAAADDVTENGQPNESRLKMRQPESRPTGSAVIVDEEVESDTRTYPREPTTPETGAAPTLQGAANPLHPEAGGQQPAPDWLPESPDEPIRGAKKPAEDAGNPWSDAEKERE